MNAPRDVETFRSTLHAEGPSAALAYLNAGVVHRYSAVYKLERGKLCNILLHDKAGEMRNDFLAEVPFETSFCQFVIRDGFFTTQDSGTDRRLDGNPYQGVVVSYHGVPIRLRGEVWGTLCHFDVASRPLPDEEFDLLQKAADVSPGFADTAEKSTATPPKR